MNWPSVRDLLAPARQIAIEPVGQRREAEDRRADQFLADTENETSLEFRQQHDDEQGDQEDAADRDRVRQIHGMLS